MVRWRPVVMGLLIAVVTATALGTVSAGAPGPAATLTVYGWSGDWDLWFQEWGAVFERQTGIKIRYVSGGGLEMFSRVVNERNSPRGDILLSSASYLFQAQNMGLLDPIDWSKVRSAAVVDGRFKFPYVAVFGFDIYELAYNYERVPESMKPTAWEDLADPRWAGKLLMRSPGSDLMAWIWMALEQRYGEEKAWEYMMAMFRNAKLWAATVGEVVQALSLGEAVVGPASIGHIMLATKQAGGTVKGSVPERDPILMLNGLAIIKNGPNRKQAEKFIDFFLDTYVQDFIMNRVGTSLAVNRTVKLANEDLVRIGLGGTPVEEVLKRAYLPDWTDWTQVDASGRTKLGKLSAELDIRAKNSSR